MRPVEYCTAEDGVRIAYRVEGDGPPLVFCHFVYAFSLSHTVPSFDEALRRIGRGRSLIRYDVRGTGLSQRNVEDLSPSATLLDVEAVVRALALERFSLFATAVGGPRAIEYAATHADAVEALVLYETYLNLGEVVPNHVLVAMAQLARADWRLATRTFVDMGVRRQDESEGVRWAEMLENSLSGDTMAGFMETHAEYDVAHLLGSVRCPTLVCHSRNDQLWPFEIGQRLAGQIPNGQLLPLETERGGPFTDPAEAIEAIDAFLPGATASVDVAPIGGAVAKPLSQRETEILRLIAMGRTSGEISSELTLSIRTVGRHITNIYGKIGARGRADATAYALRHGLANE